MLVAVFVHIVLGIAIVALVSCYLSTLWGAPWAPTAIGTVDQMLRLADVQPGETVVDLGAGDGRIVIRAARRYGALAIGAELDPIRWLVVQYGPYPFAGSHDHENCSIFRPM